MTHTVKLRSRSSREKRKPGLFWLFAAILVPVWSVMVRYRFTPQSKLPQDGPFILSPNHYSEIDPLVMGVAVWHLGRLPRFMAKASLFKIPVIGKLLHWSGQIPVEREASGQRTQVATQNGEKKKSGNPMGAASELIRRRAGVIVYPEGTLTRDPDLWPMRGKSGAVRLALESGIPLLPVAHWGTQELMPRYGKSIHPFPRKTIKVAVGEPLDLSEFQGKTLDQNTINAATAKLMDAITALLAELREEQPPAKRWDPSEHQQSETGRF